MAKSVLSSLPVYAMQALWIPEAVCEYIDKRIRACIWAKGCQSRGLNLVPWREVNQRKEEGGLGVRSSRLNNVALLGKLVEELVHDSGKFWVTTLAHKYLQHESVLEGKYKPGDSYIWRSIVRAKNSVTQGFKPLMGSGESSLWYDNWLGTGKLCN